MRLSAAEMALAFIATCFLLASTEAVVLNRRSLEDDPLAVCADGSPAAYYYQNVRTLSMPFWREICGHFQVTQGRPRRLMIYLVASEEGEESTCSSASSCVGLCERRPHLCASPKDGRLVREEGIWSDDPRNNPFASHHKVRNWAELRSIYQLDTFRF